MNIQNDENLTTIMMNPPFGGSELETIKNNFPAELRSSETAGYLYFGCHYVSFERKWSLIFFGT